MVEARAKAAWVNTMPAMALVEVITTTTAAATIILSICLSPFAGAAPGRANLHEERSNPRLYPANVAPVSLVSRPPPLTHPQFNGGIADRDAAVFTSN
jgi:hypothetical protein